LAVRLYCQDSCQAFAKALSLLSYQRYGGGARDLTVYCRRSLTVINKSITSNMLTARIEHRLYLPDIWTLSAGLQVHVRPLVVLVTVVAMAQPMKLWTSM
jgi:hypothetical protein